MNNRTKPPRQASLFGDSDPVTSAALVTVAKGPAPHSAAQRTFNQLTDKIRRQRDALAVWEAYTVRLQQRVALELVPAEREVRDAQRRLVRRLDALLARQSKGERLSRRHRSRLRSHVLSIIDNLLGDGPDSELEALHDKYSEVSREALRRDEMELAESLLGEVVEGHQARDLDELLRHADAKLAEQAETQARQREARAAKRAARRRGRPTQAERAAECKAQAEREAGRSVREIFRKLASALHPDRETDDAERSRKTRLMQRVNQAYERSDLLELLALQIEIEQIDADHLANAPEERLRHYNDVLRQQLRTLEAQVEERIAPFRFELDLPMRGVTTRHMDDALSARIAETQALRQQIEIDLEALDDPRRRRTLLDALPDLDDSNGFDDLLALSALLDEGPMQWPPPMSRRQRKRRR
ncbi:MAG: J domain-containing protein [Gammaproteobacteria bacterium]|nr:J domain-containing protein [Gammaproteobacteria bacterium]